MSALQLQRYHTDRGMVTALIVSEAHKWMTILVVDGGRLRLIREPVTERQYMVPAETNERKAKASLRRLARKRGTSRKIRAAIAELVQS